MTKLLNHLQVLTLTSWIATNLTRKTVYQIASEQGLKDEELEQTLQETSTLLDGIKYLCLPAATDQATCKDEPQESTDLDGKTGIQAVENSKNSLLGMLSPEMLEKFANFYSSKNNKIADAKSQKSDSTVSPSDNLNDAKSTKKNAKESPLDSLTSVFQEFTKFQHQDMKQKKRKSGKKDLDPDTGKYNVEVGKSHKDFLKHEEEDWELVEREMILSSNLDQPTFNANETVYIGFNNVYQFEWKMNPDRKNQATKFRLVDTSSSAN
jgi:hypothetical protein